MRCAVVAALTWVTLLNPSPMLDPWHGEVLDDWESEVLDPWESEVELVDPWSAEASSDPGGYR